MPDRYVYSASYIYSAQASEMGVRAVFVYASGIYPIWAKHASTCRTQAYTHTKRADTISDTDSRLISVKSVFNFYLNYVSSPLLSSEISTHGMSTPNSA